ncbi:MAG: LytTR family transcriptional regulator DNA-binding domain-containing protein, partial [Bacteroidia bacterium]
AIEEKLPSAKFIRVHKSFIISIDKISSIRKNRILVNESEVPLSDLYRANLFKIINPESI